MPSGLLTLLKYVFLVVLYLFFLRVLRAVWVELREPKPAAVAATPEPEPLAHPVAAPAAAAAGPAPLLRVTAPPERAGQTFALGEELTLGRAAGCGISLPDDTFVSSVHARVFRRHDGLWVEDLGSTNGTLLNDHPVSGPVPLHAGDVLQVGRTGLELVA